MIACLGCVSGGGVGIGGVGVGGWMDEELHTLETRIVTSNLVLKCYFFCLRVYVNQAKAE